MSKTKKEGKEDEEEKCGSWTGDGDDGFCNFSGCGNAEKGSKKEAKDSAGKVGCILGVGGLGDQAFNDLIYEGLEKAKEELNIDFDYAEPTQVSEFELMMRDMASSGEYGAIICVGFDQTDALSKVAPEFPDQQFAFIDGTLEAENVVNMRQKRKKEPFWQVLLRD
mgnify:CR=1 FL=1